MIKSSRVLLHPKVVWTILKNTPTLDPLVIILNSKLYYIEKNEKIASFLTIKEWKDSTEIGTVYTNPEFRNKGLAKKLISNIVKKYKKVGLICKNELIPFYEKQGLKKSNLVTNKIEKRKDLFNKTLSKILRYKLYVMKN
ncbi:MAG: GNAT family N-acetyltransferase [Candidatus Pacearchaeota archaeon]